MLEIVPGRMSRAVRNRLRRGTKWLLRLANTVTRRSSQPADILLIFGCQRSGTTMMLNILERDMRSVVYRDISVLTSDDTEHGIRFNALDRVQREFTTSGGEFIVAKPLVESQRCREFLSFFAGSRAVWMYRHFRDVVGSDLKRFGLDNGIRNLGPIVAGDEENWRSEGVAEDVRSLVTRHFSESMNPYDAAALFWYARNRLFFDQRLDRHPRIALLRYEAVAADPEQALRAVYDFVDRDFPGSRILTDVRSSPTYPDEEIQISQEVTELCSALFSQLEATWRQGATYVPLSLVREEGSNQ